MTLMSPPPPAVTLLLRRWRQLNPMPAAARGQHTEIAARWRAIVFRDPCAYCGGVVETLDHIVPKARGGGHSWANFTGACSRCNTLKADDSLLAFVRGAPARHARNLRVALAQVAAEEMTRPGSFGLMAGKLADALELLPRSSAR